jgi:transposase
MGAACALAASDDTAAGWALAGPPPGPQRHLVQSAHRGALAGPARAVWALGDRVQAVRALADRRDWARIEAALRTQADAAGELDWDAQIDSSVVRAHQHAAGARKGGLEADHAARRQALGRSRGGLTTKLHTIGDGRGRNLATRLTPGQDADTAQLLGLVDAVRVARPGGRGRPRTRVAHLVGDKAYSSRANRAALRARRIPHTIPEREDQQANRACKGARGGRPPASDRVRYRERNQVERLMNRRKQFRAVATRFDKLAVRYQATVCVADIFIWLRAKRDRTRPSPRRQTV